MQELDIATALDWRGRTVVDREGEKIGTLKEIYLDESERPGWGSIHTGLFGLRETLVPLSEAQPEGDELRIPYERDHVKEAPNVDPDVQLTAEEEERLYRHYGQGTPASGEQSDRADEPEPSDRGDEPEPSDRRDEPEPSDRRDEPEPSDRADEPEPSDRADEPGAVRARSVTESGAVPPTDTDRKEQPESPASSAPDRERSAGGAASGTADDAMTRSEEEVRIGKRTRERGRVRLKKYVVTDYVETKVPVKREKVRLEREPPDESDAPG